MAQPQPHQTALMLIDMQRGFIDKASPLCIAGAASSIPACATTLRAARERNIAIVHVRRSYAANGSNVEAVRYSAWERGGKPLSAAWPDSIDPPVELVEQPGELVLTKPSFSAFFGTDLHDLLRARGITTLLLAGTTTPNCVRATAYDALQLGYNAAVITDATSSRTPQAQAANLEDLAAVGIQLLSSIAFATTGLETLRDQEAEKALACADGGRVFH